MPEAVAIQSIHRVIDWWTDSVIDQYWLKYGCLFNHLVKWLNEWLFCFVNSLAHTSEARESVKKSKVLWLPWENNNNRLNNNNNIKMYYCNNKTAIGWKIAVCSACLPCCVACRVFVCWVYPLNLVLLVPFFHSFIFFIHLFTCSFTHSFSATFVHWCMHGLHSSILSSKQLILNPFVSFVLFVIFVSCYFFPLDCFPFISMSFIYWLLSFILFHCYVSALRWVEDRKHLHV